MSTSFFLIDAFTDHPFAGNPAGVCLLDAPAPASWMQKVAHEVGASETAFVIGCEAEQPRLRWFTPTDEVDLCGHATLAAAHALREHAQSDARQSVSFSTASGTLTARYTAAGRITLDFPADPPVETPLPDGLVEACGVSAPTYTGRSARDWLIRLDTPGDVQAARPDMEVLARVETRGVILTAQATGNGTHDFVSRFFAPRVGVPEDPVTGSAHCALGPYWGRELSTAQLVGRQISARGGTVRIHLPEGPDGDRVMLTGACATIVRGQWVAEPTTQDATPPQSSSR